MKRVLAMLLVLAIPGARAAGPAVVETHDLHYGRIEAPQGYTLKQTGTADSFRGTLRRSADGFTISFDIGYGTRVTRGNPDPAAFLRTHSIDGEFAYTSLKRVDGKLTVATTICDWCERGQRLREQSDAVRSLPPGQREARSRELAEQMNQLNQESPHPANFWADIPRDEDLVEFMLIVESYRATAAAKQRLPAITGDRAQVQPTDESFDYGQAEDGLSLGIWTQSQAYQLNHVLNVWISLHNASGHAVTPEDPAFRNSWLYVTTPRGGISAVALGAPNVPHGAGAAMGVGTQLHGMIREPGTYSVQWKAGTAKPMEYSHGSPATSLESGVVTFTVLPE
jgi:hypothetical protein